MKSLKTYLTLTTLIFSLSATADRSRNHSSSNYNNDYLAQHNIIQTGNNKHGYYGHNYKHGNSYNRGYRNHGYNKRYSRYNRSNRGYKRNHYKSKKYYRNKYRRYNNYNYCY